MTLPHRDFCLIRHGQTTANRDGIIAGTLEAQLTREGQKAALALANSAWPQPFALFTSPQDRARETIWLAFPDHRAQIVEGLRERDWGIHEGQPIAELPPRTATPRNGEAWDDLLIRVGTALAECIALADGALPIIVAHSGVIRAARALTGGTFTGPSAPNTTPLLFSAKSGSWQETPLFATRIEE